MSLCTFYIILLKGEQYFKCKNHRFFIILLKSYLLLMQATFRQVTSIQKKPISINWNTLDIRIEKCQKPIGKYKKVGKQTKSKLIALIEQGVTIIKASSSLRINYSTAKSILQNLKKHVPEHDYAKESTSPSCNQELNRDQCPPIK